MINYDRVGRRLDPRFQQAFARGGSVLEIRGVAAIVTATGARRRASGSFTAIWQWFVGMTATTPCLEAGIDGGLHALARTTCMLESSHSGGPRRQECHGRRSRSPLKRRRSVRHESARRAVRNVF